MGLIAELGGWTWVVAGTAVTVVLTAAIIGWTRNEWRTRFSDARRAPDVAHTSPEDQATERTAVDERSSDST
jgi:hypothetical protein